MLPGDASEQAALELCRRVLVAFLERHGQIYYQMGDRARSDVLVGLSYRLRGGNSVELHHLRQALAEASRYPG